MTVKDKAKDTKIPLPAVDRLTAPVIKTNVTPKPALKEAIAKNAQDVTAPPAVGPDSDFAFQQFMRLMIFSESSKAAFGNEEENKYHTDIDLNVDNVGPGFDPKNPIDQVFSAFRRDNSGDRETTAHFERYVLQNPQYYPRYSVTPDKPGQSFVPPAFKIDPTEARKNLAKDLVTVSNMYAAEAGMKPADFAKVLGGVAVIESRFGVLREVKGTKYESSASGAFHYLNGTMAGHLRNNAGDKRITDRLTSLGIDINDGISKREVWLAKDDNIVAGSTLAKDVIRIVQANPALRSDPEALIKRVYQEHNMGAAGARALAQGGITAVEKVDHRIDDNNPMFFRGASSAKEVDNRYAAFTGKAFNAAAPLIDEAMGLTGPTMAAAKQSKVAEAVKNLPTPQPS